MTKRGFTYIELGVVLLILGLLAGVAMPRYASLVRAQRLTDFRDGLSWIAGQARETAISRGESVDLQYDENEARMQVVSAESQDSTADPLRTLEAPDGVEVVDKRSETGDNGNTAWSVRFYPDGTASSAAIQFEAEGETYSLVIGNRGGGQTVRGEMPEEEPDEWEAGDYVRRTE